MAARRQRRGLPDSARETELRELRLIDLGEGSDRPIDYADHPNLAAADPVFQPESGQALFTRDGNVFIDPLDGSPPRQLRRSSSKDQQAGFSADGRYAHHRRGHQWWRHEIETGLAWPVADLRFEPDPDAEPEDSLAQMQLRLFSSLREDAERATVAGPRS